MAVLGMTVKYQYCIQ